jgi:hypothetical protein
VDGKFTASGGAVDAGVVCTDGTIKWSEEIVDGVPKEWMDVVTVSDFTCSDGSGTFMTETTANVVFSGTTAKAKGLWEVLSGTGAYEALEGGGPWVALCGGVGGDCDSDWVGAVTP